MRCTPRSWAGLAATAFFAVMVLASRSAHADSDWSERPDAFGCVTRCDDQSTRTLAGHTFIPSSLVDWTFITSQVASTTSAGFGELDIPASPLASALDIESEDYVFAEQTLLASLAVTRWFSIAVRAQAAGILPSTRIAAVVIGAEAAFGGTATPTLRLVRTDRFQASVLADFGALRAHNIIPTRLPSSPYVKGDIETIRPALAIAWAPHPRIGLQASASFAWRWFDFADNDQTRTVAAGAALTVALDPAPFHLLLAGQYSHDWGREDATILSTALFGTTDSRAWGEVGLVYRGRRELDVGGAFLWKMNDTDTESRWLGQLFIAYYF